MILHHIRIEIIHLPTKQESERPIANTPEETEHADKDNLKELTYDYRFFEREVQ